MRVALQGEQRGYEFYYAVAGTTENGEIRDMADEFVREEAEHVEVLKAWITREEWLVKTAGCDPHVIARRHVRPAGDEVTERSQVRRDAAPSGSIATSAVDTPLAIRRARVDLGKLAAAHAAFYRSQGSDDRQWRRSHSPP